MNDEKEQKQDAILRAKDLADVSSSEGGKLLIKASSDGVFSILRVLASQYRTLSHVEMIAYCASLSEKLALLDVLYGAPGDHTRAAEDLKEYLKESME